MTEPSPERDLIAEEPGAAMPRWVPVLIGAILVTLAALAVYTGLRYREGKTITAHVQPQRDVTRGAAPPGEPGAGESLVLPGEEGSDNTPAANEPVQGSARAVITGGAGGVQSTVRMWASRGMMLRVTPGTAMVYVNDLPIGEVSQFDTEDEVYDFAEPGSYTVRLVAPGGAERTFIVTASDEAERDIAVIDAKLD
jgi:hypothetical protein